MTSSDSLARERLFDCTNLVAVITGGGTGMLAALAMASRGFPRALHWLGAVMARALARNGATVYILGRRLSALESVSASYNNPGPGTITPITCDVTSKDSLEAAAANIAAQTGFVNLVIANAGTLGPTNRDLQPRAAEDPKGPLSIQEAKDHLWQVPMEDVVDVYKVNVAGALYTAVAFLDLLDKGNAKGNVQQTSQVLVTSSIGGFHRNWMAVGLAYTTSKAAVTHLTKSLASFLVQWRIRVNGLAPGLFLSEMTQAVWADNDLTREGSAPTSSQPLGRAGRDEEMAGSVLYFASRAGAFCSGSIHVVDGGRLGVQPGATY